MKPVTLVLCVCMWMLIAACTVDCNNVCVKPGATEIEPEEMECDERLASEQQQQRENDDEQKKQEEKLAEAAEKLAKEAAEKLAKEAAEKLAKEAKSKEDKGQQQKTHDKEQEESKQKERQEEERKEEERKAEERKEKERKEKEKERSEWEINYDWMWGWVSDKASSSYSFVASVVDEVGAYVNDSPVTSAKTPGNPDPFPSSKFVATGFTLIAQLQKLFKNLHTHIVETASTISSRSVTGRGESLWFGVQYFALAWIVHMVVHTSHSQIRLSRHSRGGKILVVGGTTVLTKGLDLMRVFDVISSEPLDTIGSMGLGFGTYVSPFFSSLVLCVICHVTNAKSTEKWLEWATSFFRSEVMFRCLFNLMREMLTLTVVHMATSCIISSYFGVPLLFHHSGDNVVQNVTIDSKTWHGILLEIHGHTQSVGSHGIFTLQDTNALKTLFVFSGLIDFLMVMDVQDCQVRPTVSWDPRIEDINKYAQATAYLRLENINRYAQATAYLGLENIYRYAQATAYLGLENINRYAQATAYLGLENINRYAQATAYLRL